MVKTKKNQILQFPLIEEAKIEETSLFSAHQGYEVPSYIDENLHHDLRYYQQAAIRNYHYALAKKLPPQHVLFNMSTGSGKTDLMAALILYLYKEQGYQNFLFTVNTNSVLMKTRDNLVDQTSEKYLFDKKLVIDGQNIKIKEVDRFVRQPQKNTIYIKFESVQKVSDDLFVLKEGKMGLEDYEKSPVAILADEAHHYSASTKKEKTDENTWESAINKVLRARDDKEQKNILLEFTATVDFDKEVIYEKYRDKVVYRYPLANFMQDGYSKQVKRIETSANDCEKMLNAVLLSQFRKYRALAEGVKGTFKPVIMFKSPKVAISKETHQLFNDVIASLTADELLKFIQHQQLLDSNDSSALELAYRYYLKNKDRLDMIVREIKHDFDPRNILNANDASGNMLEKGQYEALNTLESPNNLYRVVFAVAKLTEGWDVLNLYDIVRIEKEAKTNRAATMVEAQLIGRGARYYPFELSGKRSFKRRFDDDPSNASLILETLHYHTMNEPQYLKQLRNSLEQMDLPTGKDEKNPPIEIKVKPTFKRTDVYKHGKIYYNETKAVEDSYFDSLKKYGIDHKNDVRRVLYFGTREVGYKDISGETATKELYVERFDARFVKKAIQKLEFYRFSNLKKYLPLLRSMDEFIYGKNWLNADELKLYLTVPIEFSAKDITANEVLQVVVDLLAEYARKISSGYVKQRGTNCFIGYPIKEYLSNYKKRIPQMDIQTLLTPQDINNYDMNDADYDFYVYEKAIVNRLEYSLIERIKGHIAELRQKYGKEVYLVRMDEQMHRGSVKAERLKLHHFGDLTRRDGTLTEVHLQGFQPDFILLLEDENFYFQIFIEPKGMSGERFEKERWKEDLLLYLTDHQAEIEFEDGAGNVKISGVKFFTKDDGQHTVSNLVNTLLKENIH